MIKTLGEESILTICNDVAEPEQVLHLSFGDVLVRPEVGAEKVYVIKSGVFKIEVGHLERKFSLDFISSGHVTGLVNLYQPSVYPCTISCVSAAVVYSWDRIKILELMSLMPEVSKKIKHMYARWGVRMVERMKCLVFMSPRQRVLSWILDSNSRSCLVDNNVWRVLSASEMAAFCNLNVVDFKMCLQELEGDGLIKVERDCCYILNRKGVNDIIASPQ